MSKRFKGVKCVYCNARDSVTGDHIFAKEFFLPSARADLPQAPTCDVCNNDKSKLEHYLTAVLPFGGRHGAAIENLATQVPKRLRRNARLHRELAAELHDSPDPLGPNMTIGFNGEYVEHLFSMIARGLLWHHWRTYLPTGHAVRSVTVTKAGERLYDDLIFKRTARNRVTGNLGMGTFIYEGVQATDDPAFTGWRFLIYGGLQACEDPTDPASAGSQIIAISGRQSIVESLLPS
jgi:hypothetical protein